MDPRSVEIFDNQSEYILGEAAARYGVTADALQRLGSFESYVFAYSKDGREYILKLTHSLHRTKEAVMAELDWVNYLADNGVTAARTIPSIHDRLVEVVEVEDSYFLVYAFEKAAGRLSKLADWDGRFIENWGRIIGRMHALTQDYVPPAPDLRRHAWHEDVSLDFEKHLPDSQTRVIEQARKLLKEIASLPHGRDSYGLVHSDMHHGNFFVDDGRLIAFDFDDCHYDWFANDIAMPLFYVMRDADVGSDNLEFARFFWSTFINGYSSENSLAPEWAERIQLFLKLRELDLYTIIHAESAFDLSPWIQRFMDGRQQAIEENTPVIDIDFSWS